MARTKRGSGFKSKARKIDYRNFQDAVELLTHLESMKSAGWNIKLYDSVTKSSSTNRMLCQLFGMTPNQENKSAIKDLIRHFRASSQIIPPSPMSIRRRGEAARKRAQQAADAAAEPEAEQRRLADHPMIIKAQHKSIAPISNSPKPSASTSQ
ncbi:uncharacterized protein LOC129577988 isoform X2 [Sitodiplosis mosellana]|uniref:uncharacterized protein LOC129577988 isoform X2 n=1 Tax=Sitodiplosis mosellana TaxID=263140 RepID=UPI0024448DCC|nr:uncharacterized protein LOC129577988 isoform X2 [Sitodiplosis mosellana]